MSGVLAALLAELGPDVVRTGPAIPERNRQDAAGGGPVTPVALVLPRRTEEVSTALRICHAHRQPVGPQGGLTGLAGGAHPAEGEVALSLERMTGVEEIDRDAGMMTALAGTPLKVIQDAAADAGLLCGIDLGARGSCIIGGNDATNAGGNQVLRYGMTRRSVLGLEVVLADGIVLRSLNKMMKNNAGYDWSQLFIGSEGMLGVVTRVVIGLHPLPAGIETALVSVPTVAEAVALLRAVERSLPRGLVVFEAMWADFVAIAVARLGLAEPFGRPQPLLLLIETPGDGGPGDREALEAFLAGKIEAGRATDAVIAQSGHDRARFWAYREPLRVPPHPAAGRRLRHLHSHGQHGSGGADRERGSGSAFSGDRPGLFRPYRGLEPASDRDARSHRRRAQAGGRAGDLSPCRPFRRRDLGKAWRRPGEARLPTAQPQRARAGADAHDQGRAGSGRHPESGPGAGRNGGTGAMIGNRQSREGGATWPRTH